MIRVLFCCHGNICRSPMGQWILQKLVDEKGRNSDFKIDSAATSREEIGNDMYPPAKQKLREKGIPFGLHRARQVQFDEYDDWDYIFVMDTNNVRNIRRIFPSDPKHKIHKLLEFDVADPWYTDDFETTYQDLLQGCQIWLERMLYD